MTINKNLEHVLPSGSILLNRLTDIYENLDQQDRDSLLEIWSSYLDQATNETVRLYHYNLTKSIEAVPELLRTRWVPITLDEAPEDGTETARGSVDATAKILLWIVERIISQERRFERGVDYVVDEGVVKWYADPPNFIVEKSADLSSTDTFTVTEDETLTDLSVSFSPDPGDDKIYLTSPSGLSSLIFSNDPEDPVDLTTILQSKTKGAWKVSSSTYTGIVTVRLYKSVTLWAEYAYLDDNRLFNSYGSLIDFTRESSEVYKQQLLAIFNAFWNGPAIQLIKQGVNAILTLPHIKEAGTVESIQTSINFISAYNDGPLTDITSDILDADVSTVTVWTAKKALYVGHKKKFTSMDFIIDTAGVGSGNLIIEFFNGRDWAPLVDVNDGTAPKHTVDFTPGGAIPSETFTITINGAIFAYTAKAADGVAEVVAELVRLINLGVQPVTAIDNSTKLTVEGNVIGVPFARTAGATGGATLVDTLVLDGDDSLVNNGEISFAEPSTWEAGAPSSVALAAEPFWVKLTPTSSPGTDPILDKISVEAEEEFLPSSGDLVTMDTGEEALVPDSLTLDSSVVVDAELPRFAPLTTAVTIEDRISNPAYLDDAIYDVAINKFIVDTTLTTAQVKELLKGNLFVVRLDEAISTAIKPSGFNVEDIGKFIVALKPTHTAFFIRFGDTLIGVDLSILTVLDVTSRLATAFDYTNRLRTEASFEAAQTKFTVFDDTTDVTSDVEFSGDTTEVIFAAGVPLYVGAKHRFPKVNIDLVVAAIASGKLIADYYDGTVWASLTIQYDETDTSGTLSGPTFAQDGQIKWDIPTDWEIGANALVPALPADLHFVRLTPTLTPGTLPDVDRVWGVDYLTYSGRVEDEIIGTGAGATFSTTLLRPPIRRDSVLVRAIDGSDNEMFLIDDGHGNLVGDAGGGTNTIDYSNGDIDVDFSASVKAATNVVVDYIDDSPELYQQFKLDDDSISLAASILTKQDGEITPGPALDLLNVTSLFNPSYSDGIVNFINAFDFTGAGPKTDITADILASGDTTFVVFATGSGSVLFVAYPQLFNKINVDVIGAAASGTGALTVEIFNGTIFTPVAGLGDTTVVGPDTFAVDGQISWTMPAVWAKGGDGSFGMPTNRYIAKLSIPGGAPATAPTVDKLDVENATVALLSTVSLGFNLKIGSYIFRLHNDTYLNPPFSSTGDQFRTANGFPTDKNAAIAQLEANPENHPGFVFDNDAVVISDDISIEEL
jgi:hypothetical protein